MCGIIFAESFDGNPVNQLVMKQFKAQQHRGVQGFGVFDKQCARLVRNTKKKKIMRWLKNHPSSSIMFHHRFPTSTDNVKNACHPFSTKDHFKTQYILVHNGHIGNARALKVEHEKLGIEYYSTQSDGRFNDSEALLWDVALYLEGKQDELKAYGGIAFICLAIPKDGRKVSKLHFGRNANPINMVLDEGMIMLSSEGDGEETKPNTLYSYSYRSKKLDTKALTVPRMAPYTGPAYDNSAYMGGYRPTGEWEDGEWISYSNRNPVVSAFEPNGSATVRQSVPQLTPNSGLNSGFKLLNPSQAVELDKSLQKGRKALQEARQIDESDPWGDAAVPAVAASEFIILPEDEDYTYEAIAGATAGEAEAEGLGKQSYTPLIFENNTGDMIDIKTVVAQRFDDYLDQADGHYRRAYDLLQWDIDAYVGMLLEDESNDRQQDDDTILELDILRAAKIMLSTSPFWVTVHSVDPDYQEWVADTVKNYLNQERK